MSGENKISSDLGKTPYLFRAPVFLIDSLVIEAGKIIQEFDRKRWWHNFTTIKKTGLQFRLGQNNLHHG